MLPPLENNEIEILSSVVKENKFSNFNKINYINNVEEILLYFDSGLKLLNIIMNEMNKRGDINLYNKLKEYYDRINIKEITKIIYDLNKDINFNSHKIKLKAERLYIENKFIIDELLSFIFSLGKVVKQYDIEENVGIY